MPEPTPASDPMKEKDIRENKDIAAVSYLWILSFLVYFARKDSAFIQYHAKQGIVLFLLSLPLWFIPFIGHALELFILAGVVVGFLNAFQGRYADVPMIGAVAKGEMSVTEMFKHIGKMFGRLFKKKKEKERSSDSSASFDSF